MRLTPFLGHPPPWPAPDPAQWQALADTLPCDRETLVDMLWQLNAPASLQGLACLISTLPALVVTACEQGLLGQEHAQAWLAFQRTLSTRLEEWRDQTSFRARFPWIGRSSVRNLCEWHPYYAVLMVLGPLSPSAPDLVPLLLRCWVAAVEQYPAISSDQHEAIGRALRSLYDRRGPCPDLRLTPTLEDEAVAQALEDAVPEGTTVSRGQVDLLARVLRYEFSGSSRRGGGGGGGGGGVMRGALRLQHVAAFEEAGSDPETPDEEMRPLALRRVDVRTRRPRASEYDTEARGLAPGDAGDTQTYATLPREATLTLAETLDRVRQRVDKQSIAAELAMRTQPLGFRWDLLMPHEVGVFFVALDRLVSRAPVEDTDEARHLALLLMTMVSRGLDPEQAIDCRLAVLHADEPEPEELRDVLIARRPSKPRHPAQAQWYWRTCPRWVTGGAPIRPDLVRATSPVLRLPLPPPLAAFLDRVVAPDGKSTGVSQPLIRRPQRVMALLTGAGTAKGNSPRRGWCSTLNRLYGTRLSARRISRFFPRWALAHGALDGVSIAALRGQVDATSVTQAYYQHVDPELLAARFSRGWQKIIEETLPEIAADQVPAWLRTPWPAQHAMAFPGLAEGVGSRRVPTAAAVRQVVCWLQDGIQAARGRGHRWEDLVVQHNRYVLYTLHYLLWALGARAVRDPLPDPRLIDRGTGLVVLCDKSADDRYSTRLVYAPEDFLEHLGCYHDHLRQLAHHLALRQTEAYLRLMASQREWTASTRSAPGAHRLTTPFVECLGNGEWVPLTSEAATLARLPQALRLAPNSSRHYLRTYLAERGCPEDLIDAQLGHWHHGREPWGASSSLSPQSFAGYMRGYLGQMTGELGFKPLASPLRGSRSRP